jgi:hypothetical protein
MAQGAIEHLREILSGLQGKRTMFGPRRSLDQPISLEYWKAAWHQHRDSVQKLVQRCGDADLERELDAIDAEWGTLVSSEESQQPSSPVAGDRKSRAGRTPGRRAPHKTQKWYMTRVATMTADGTIPSREEDWHAAKDEFGEGVARDHIRDLRRQFAPASWQARGRRQSAKKAGR